MARKSRKKTYECYGPVLGQLRREQGRAKTYLIFLLCAVFVCAILYAAYWFSMKR